MGLDSFIYKGKVDYCSSFWMQYIAVEVSSFLVPVKQYGKWQLENENTVQNKCFCWEAYYVCFYFWQFTLKFEFAISLSTLYLYWIQEYNKLIVQLSPNICFGWIKCIEKYDEHLLIKKPMERRSRKEKKSFCIGKSCVFFGCYTVFQVCP